MEKVFSWKMVTTFFSPRRFHEWKLSNSLVLVLKWFIFTCGLEEAAGSKATVCPWGWGWGCGWSSVNFCTKKLTFGCIGHVGQQQPIQY